MAVRKQFWQQAGKFTQEGSRGQSGSNSGNRLANVCRRAPVDHLQAILITGLEICPEGLRKVIC